MRPIPSLHISAGSIVALFLGLLLWLYLPSGVYLGGDWSLPITKLQVKQYFHPWAWSEALDFGGPSLAGILGLPFQLFFYTSTAFGLPAEYLGKILITLLFTLAFFLFYQLLRYFKLVEFSSIAGGIIYVTTPVFFNYSVMGWVFVLLAMALLPLAVKWLCMAMLRNDMRYAIGVAFVWSFAVMQTQSLAWFPFLFLSLGVYLVRDGESAKAYLKKIGVVFITFLMLCSYWWMALILFKDITVTSNTIVMSNVSVGADGHFNPASALRLWGSLYNFQFESAVSRGWAFGAWLLPVAAIIAIIGSKGEKRRLALAFGVLAFLLPAVILFAKQYREIIMVFPGAGVMRQLSRVTVVTSFAYAVLAGIFLDLLLSVRSVSMRWLLYPAIALLVVAIWPWWMGELTNYLETPTGKDIRLRIKKFPPEYYEVENRLGEIKWKSHALYLPYGMTLSYKDDPKYRGAFKEAIDVFGQFSPVPGAIMPTDRPSPIHDYMKFIQRTDNIIAAMHFTPTNFYVLRKNIEARQIQVENIFKQTNRYFPSDSFDRIWDSKNISIYLRKNLVPLVYSPPKSQLNGGQVDILGEIATSDLVEQGMAVVLATQNFGKEDSATRLAVTSEIPDAVEYRKINPTKYRVRLHHAQGDVPLLFGESYSRGWRLYPVAYRAREKAAAIAKEYAVLPGNERYQAATAEVINFAKQGWLSEIGEEFISKRYFRAIQNDNLPEGSFMDTWYLNPLPEERHIKINGYANSWVVDIKQLCSDSQVCHRNEDGSFDVELIMEFWPQQVFYIGLTITGLTIILLVIFLLTPRQKAGG